MIHILFDLSFFIEYWFNILKVLTLLYFLTIESYCHFIFVFTVTYILSILF